MIDSLASGKTSCSLSSGAECNRLWISKADGLHLGYFQTFGQDPKSREGGGPTGSVVSHTSAAANCEQCFRNHPKSGVTD
jgi:hypothetical protein